MRKSILLSAILVASSAAAWSPTLQAQLPTDQPIVPLIELQSGPLTPGLKLAESSRPVHQIRLIVDAKLRRATLVLDCNTPQFDEFGNLVGGILTPQVRGERGPLPAVELSCTIEQILEGADNWRLYNVSGPDIRTPFGIAAKGSLGDGGPSRVLIFGRDGNATTVVECTRYGLVVP